MIKAIKILYNISLICLVIMLAVIGCGGCSGSGDGDDDTGTPPSITNVILYKNGGSPSLIYEIGDIANFEVYVTDPNRGCLTFTKFTVGVIVKIVDLSVPSH